MKQINLLSCMVLLACYSWQGHANFEENFERGKTASSMTSYAPVVAPWSEDFENGGDIPVGWTQGAGNAEDWKFEDNLNNDYVGDGVSIKGSTTSGGYWAWVDDSTNNFGTTMLSPMIDVSALANPELSFFIISYSSHLRQQTNVEFSLDVYDGDTWIEDVFTSNSNTGGWVQVFVDLSSLSITGDIQLRFVVDEPPVQSWEDDFALDDVSVHEKATCPQPINLHVDDLAFNAAKLIWETAGSTSQWEVELINTTLGETFDGTSLISVSDTPSHSLTNLTAMTDYAFRVRTDCSGGKSTWSASKQFTTTTNCSVVVPFPFTESFENTSTTRGCWGSELVTGSIAWEYGDKNDDGSIAPRTGSLMAIFLAENYDDYSAKLISPSLDLTSLTDPQLTFYYANGSGSDGDIDELRVYYKTSFGGSWVQIGRDFVTEQTNWTKVVLDLPNPSSDYYIAFEGKSNWGDGLVLDDVTVQGENMGLEDRAFKGFSYYPNPVNDQLSLEATSEIQQVVIYDLLGRKVLKVAPNGMTSTLDLGDLQTGVYLMKVIIYGTEDTFTLIKE